MIKNFTEYLLESQDGDTRAVDFFASLSRNYESSKPFYTDLMQFTIEEERRDWRDTRKYVELEKKVTHEAFYKLKFELDKKMYLLEINFDYVFDGQKEKDAPETISDEDMQRLNVVLEEVRIKKIRIVSSDFNYDSSSPSDPVKKACEAFLIKMMEVDYDSLGAEIYKIEQT